MVTGMANAKGRVPVILLLVLQDLLILSLPLVGGGTEEKKFAIIPLSPFNLVNAFNYFMIPLPPLSANIPWTGGE